MARSTAGKNACVGGLTAVAVYASLHTGDPSTTGANEVSGGSPAYARKAITWNSPSGGSATLAGSVTFDVPAGTTVAHVGLWSAATSGTYYDSADVTDEAYVGQGTYVLNAATSFSVT